MLLSPVVEKKSPIILRLLDSEVPQTLRYRRKVCIKPQRLGGVDHTAGLREREDCSIQKGGISMLLLILVIVLLIMMFGSLPTWPHSRSWGYYPSGGIGVVLLILVILFLLGWL
jgi:hypothetical protein